MTQDRQLVNTYQPAQAPGTQLGKESAAGTVLPTGEKQIWGVQAGAGQNLLGAIIEQVRNDIQDDCEIERWIMSTF